MLCNRSYYCPINSTDPIPCPNDSTCDGKQRVLVPLPTPAKKTPIETASTPLSTTQITVIGVGATVTGVTVAAMVANMLQTAAPALAKVAPMPPVMPNMFQNIRIVTVPNAEI